MVSLALAVIAAVLPPVVVWLGKHLVDLVVEGAQQGASNRTVVPTVIGLGIGSAAYRVVSTLQTNRQALLASLVEFHAQGQLLNAMAQEEAASFDDPAWHDMASRATADLNWRPYAVASQCVTLATALLSLGAMVLLLASLSPLLAALPLVAVIPSWLTQRRIQADLYEFWINRTTEERRRDYYRDLLCRAEAAREVRAYSIAEHFIGRHADLSRAREGAMRKLYGRADKAVSLSAVATGLALAAAYFFVADRGLSGEFTPGDLALVIGAYGAVSGQLSALVGSVTSIAQNATFLEDYFAFLRRNPSRPAPALPLAASPSAEGVRFENVSFIYPNGERPALCGVSFEIGPGEILAVVGSNGAGKSTLVKLLLGFVTPDEGVVRVWGTDVSHIDKDELMSRTSVLFQDFLRYELTVRDNITLGRVTAAGDTGRAMRALAAAGGTELVDGLHDGLDTTVGRQFESGHDLSGGEWQRLALARVFFRDADLWILDEPTSALDPATEDQLFESLRAALGRRMALVISHRFTTVRRADRIAVLDHGSLVEIGTHDELVARNGAYARLFSLPAVDR